MKNSLCSRARRGFTLIEMLVVISIIALLSAILFPVFSRVREGGRAAVCSNNMKQLGLAFQQYQLDNKFYPYAGNYQAWGPGLGHWVAGTRAPNGSGLVGDVEPFTRNGATTVNVEEGALFPFVKSASTYVCPSTETNPPRRLGYSMNCAVSALSSTKLRTPQDIVLLVDEGRTLNDGYFWAVGGPVNTDELTKVHNGGGNLLFCDGHVKFFPFEKFPLNGDADDIKTRVTGSPRFHDLAFGGAPGTPNQGTSQAGATGEVTGTIVPGTSACFAPPAAAAPAAPNAPGTNP